MDVPENKHLHSETAKYISKYETELEKQIHYVNTLPWEQQDALKEYTGSMYSAINKSLYKKDVSNYYVEYINVIDEAFKNVPPLQHSLIVYRGIKLDKKITESFKSLSYVSTSSDKNISLVFNAHKEMTCCFFEIYIPKGSHVLPLRSISEFPDEMEILLPRESCFTIVKKEFTPKANTMIVKYSENLNSLIPFEKKQIKKIVPMSVTNYNNLKIYKSLIPQYKYYEQLDTKIKNDVDKILNYSKNYPTSITKAIDNSPKLEKDITVYSIHDTPKYATLEKSMIHKNSKIITIPKGSKILVVQSGGQIRVIFPKNPKFEEKGTQDNNIFLEYVN